MTVHSPNEAATKKLQKRVASINAVLKVIPPQVQSEILLVEVLLRERVSSAYRYLDIDKLLSTELRVILQDMQKDSVTNRKFFAREIHSIDDLLDYIIEDDLSFGLVTQWLVHKNEVVEPEEIKPDDDLLLAS